MTLAAAVEGLARAMGWWMDARGVQVDPTSDWTIGVWAKCGFIVRRRRLLTDGGSVTDETWDLTSHEAMLVLRCALLGTTQVRCPDCEGERAVRDYDDRCMMPASRGPSDHYQRPCPTCTGPAVECETCEGKGGWQRPSSWDGCRKCDSLGTIPTGHVDRPWAEVLLGAMPRECPDCEGLGGGFEEVEDSPFEDDMGAEWDCLECGGGWNRRGSGKAPGDPEARTLLSVKADELQANGDPLGLWVALWLGQQPCEARSCKDGQIPAKLGPAIQGHDGQVVYPIIETAHCPRCAGSGLALGAHDRAMAEAGERLAEQLEGSAVEPA